jgi:hypothetical protein
VTHREETYPEETYREDRWRVVGGNLQGPGREFVRHGIPAQVLVPVSLLP